MERKLTGGPRRTPPIVVTQPIIDRAETANSDHCMIADAIRAAIPDAKAVSVDLMTIRWTDPVKRQRYIYLCPRGIQLALISFDQGVHTAPFTFRLGSPVQVVAAGGKTTTTDGKTTNPSRKIQGVISVSGGTARPIKLGGALPGRAELGSAPVTPQTASSKRHLAARAIKEAEEKKGAAEKAKELRATAPKARANVRAAAKKASADRAEGLPPTDATNITLEQSSRRHVREFGLKQLVK